MNLFEELQKSKGQWSVCVGRIEALHERSAHLESIIESCKQFIQRQPEVVNFLEEFQRHSHKRSVGVYEELLSALVNEVLPGDRKIQLSLTTERSLPALEIVSVKDGKVEDIMEGSGGSLVNIISAGLRIIALARSQCAPFLLLDEADCWLAPGRVGQFGAIIGQVARDIGIQVLMISHHDARYFEPYSTLLRLVKRQGGLHIDRLNRGAEDEEGLFQSSETSATVQNGNNQSIPKTMKQRRIISVELTNFMSHKDSVIPMSDTVTCVTGENDIGKSAIAAALRSIFYGDSSDSFVHHDAKSFKVMVVLNTGERIVFEHFLKKSPKRHWAWYVPGKTEALMDGTPKHGVPDWLGEVFRVERFEGLDVQLANQKNPVFLLNEPASKRASILSIGSESHTLQQMIQINRQQTQEQNVLLKTSESEHASLERKKKLLLPFDKLGVQLEEGLKRVELLIKQKELMASFSVKLERLRVLQGLSRIQLKGFQSKSLEIKSVRIWSSQMENFARMRVLKGCQIPKPHSVFDLNQIKSVPFSDMKRLGKAKRVMHVQKIEFKGKLVPLHSDMMWRQKVLNLKYLIYRAKIHIDLTVPRLERDLLVNNKCGLDRLNQLKKVLQKIELPMFNAMPLDIKKNQRLEQLIGLKRINVMHYEKVERAKTQFEYNATQLNDKLKEVYRQLGGKCPLCYQGFEFKKIIGINSEGNHADH